MVGLILHQCSRSAELAPLMADVHLYGPLTKKYQMYFMKCTDFQDAQSE